MCDINQGRKCHMKKLFSLFLCLSLLCGCAQTGEGNVNTDPSSDPGSTAYALPSGQSSIVTPQPEEIGYTSRFSTETLIRLNDEQIIQEGDGLVLLSHDIIYYEDRDTYDSGLPYGEGDAEDRHTAEEAAAHTVVTITEPGAYRITGTLSAGQIRVDLGEDAYSDPNAVVELILDNADITCTVAPAILFLNVYECDGDWSTETASATVDTSRAGAVVVLAEGSENSVNGSHVAKIYKDKEGEKKLWKQDAAFYSYMSMNIFGTGTLDLTADNEGLGTELHLTINGGSINIRSQDDGINTNEDGVSVTAINGGSVHIIAGLGAEGDGIDSNGYLVINGGTVVSSAHPASDAGLDSDLGSYVNGGTVIALGSTMDWAESDSEQVTMNLQFAAYQNSDCAIVISREDGGIIFAYDPGEDEVLGSNVRQYMGAVISSPNLQVGESYLVYLDGKVTGSDTGGIYLTESITAYEGGVRQMYTGTDVGNGFPGGPGGFGGQFPGGQMPDGQLTPPDSDAQLPEDGQFPGGGQPPEGFEMPENEEPPEVPDGFQFPGNGQPPEGFGGGQRGEMPGDTTGTQNGTALFYMNDKVNAFSGVTAYTESVIPAE